MCVFTDYVEDVSNTNIFAALVGPKTQLTVYSNNVALANNNAVQQFPTFFNSSFIPPSNTNLWWENSNNNWQQPNPSPWASFHPYSSESLQMYQPDGTPVAMVLAIPLPNGNSDTIKMVDMSNCRDFFSNLKEAFPEMRAMTNYGSEDMTFSMNKIGAQSLPVKRCGPYSYSIVPDVDSFTRLKNKTFRVNPRIHDVMRNIIPEDTLS